MNILIIGCSHSAGSYIYSNFKESCDYTNGWWSYVDCLKDHRLSVYTTPGLGWTTWSSILYHLNKDKQLLKFDRCIIQDTFEPRFALLKPDPKIYTHRPNKNIHLYEVMLKESTLLIDRDWFLDIEAGSEISPAFLSEYSKSSSKWPTIYASRLLGLKILEDVGVPTYYFSYYEKNKRYMTNKFIDINLYDLWAKSDKFHTYKWMGLEDQPDKREIKTAPHLNIEGNKRIGKLVNKSLMKKGFDN